MILSGTLTMAVSRLTSVLILQNQFLLKPQVAYKHGLVIFSEMGLLITH